MREPVRALRARRRVHPVHVVEVRRRAHCGRHHAGEIRASHDEAAARIDERDVCAEAEVVRELVRRVEACGVPMIRVVRPPEDSRLTKAGAGEKEAGSVAAARDADVVVDLLAVLEQFTRVIVQRHAVGDGRPETRGHAAAVCRGARARDPAGALAVLHLQRIRVIHLVDRRRAAERVVRATACAAVFRRDEDDALPGARAVERARGRALQHLHRLDVVGVHVRCPVRVRGIADEIGGGRHCRVIDWRSVDHEQRLSRSRDGLEPADVNARRGAGVTGLRRHQDVRCLGGERVHEVLFVAAQEFGSRDGVDRVAEFLRKGLGARAGDDDLAQVERIALEREVPVDAACQDYRV